MAAAERPERALANPFPDLSGFGGRMIIVGLTVLVAWPVIEPSWVAGWTALAILAGGGEGLAASGGGAAAPRRRGLLAVLTVASSALCALAAFVLIARGGPSPRLYAFTLMTVSMVHVLMLHYRRPWVFLASIAPNVAVLVMIGVGLVERSLQRGETLSALTPVATVALFAALFWTARAQLARAWTDLAQAKTDAQERERAAEAASRAKSQFLAIMSHEIRTPLNGVLGMAQAMAGDRLSDVQRARLKTIRRSGESLLAVLNDVLDLSKIEASKLELELVEFDLAHMARGVVAAFTPLANRKGVSFGFEIEPAALGAYRGDSTRLRQILYNLVANAVKFTEAGHVQLTVRRDAETLVFEVFDTGVGIAPENLDRLFDSFFQADASTTRRHGGSGLGLTIVRELTSLMGGTIEAESTPGVGSSFRARIALPRADGAGKAAAAPAVETPTDGADPARPVRVLAAEDNEVNQLVLKTLLLQAGIDPTVVPDGAAAVEAWEAEDWDVILMDIQMPRMDGLDATRAIRLSELRTGRRRTPIIALTANAMTHQRAEYLAAGMDDLVPKPIEVGRLFNALDQALAAWEGDPLAANA